jgi:rod shape-determining protein MreD
MANSNVQSSAQQSSLPVGVLCVLSAIALLMSVWPLPVWAWWLRPEWVVMLVIYCVISFPFRMGMVYAWLMGLGLDLLVGRIVGQHALALTIVAYLVLLFHQRAIIYTLGQQSLSVFGLVLLYQLTNYWVYGLTGGMLIEFSFLLSALSSALVWPLFYYFIQYTVTRFGRR